ncbi:MAG: gliding motility-associated C-terminal domain-containing protein [Flavobacteriales bacterium]|nr:gliding motility-associated C-terminal domain-containing protein [Flavobacteriales bacterium]MCB9363238.1 gliding motility-associated C-terminal domain-containing protein [Flavobacteriales bacterium]
MNKLTLIVTFISLVCYQFTQAQQLVYSDILYGGVTGNGATRGVGSGSINLSVQIPPNSSIRKAYLLAARDSATGVNTTVILNGIDYTFSDSTVITKGFTSIINGSLTYTNSSIHAIDITRDIDSSITSYNLFIPPPTTQFGFYYTIYMYIVFENNTFPLINCNLFFNNQDVSSLTNYNLSNLSPIKNLKPVCLTLITGHICDTLQDGSYVNVNNNNIGLIGGDDMNSSIVTCASVYSNFAHYNDSLFGLDDDTPDSLMAGTDALADIKSYVNNGDTAVNVTFTYQSNFAPLTNPIRAVMLSYATPCDTFSTSASTNTDTICAGEPVQLNATGGAEYSWFGAFGGLSDTSIANPIATPTQTTTYIVTIKNDSGCVKTEHVKIWVNPLPKPDTIIVSPQRCGSQNGSIAVGTINNGGSPFTYSLTNLQTLATSNQQLATFNNLLAGNYEIQITDANGCVWKDSATSAEINDINANFNLYTIPNVFPQPNPIGTAPLTVYTQNASVNANNFEWTISNQLTVNSIIVNDTITQYSSLNTQHTFEEGGTFEICLFAYNNIATCGDTVCKTIVIAPNPSIDSLVIVIPNVFSPNGDGQNDNFVIEIQSANLLESLEVEIFNRWGQLVSGSRFDVQGLASAMTNSSSGLGAFVIWDGTTTTGTKVPDGTYFYVFTYTTKTNETKTEKGAITLLR